MTITAMTNGKQNSAQAALDKFSEMMIARMEKIKAEDWKMGWIGASAKGGMPQNLTGRTYSGSNSFFLQLDTAMKGYRIPVYLTFMQVLDQKANVRKGEKSTPVFYWDVMFRDKDGKRVSHEAYSRMSETEKKDVESIPFLKTFNVFNIDQTSFPEVHPDRMEKLLKNFEAPEMRDTEGMFASAALDRMFEHQEWLCPIQTDRPNDGAYYSPSKDHIVLPMKNQFNKGNTPEEIYKDGMEFYATALHEMAHSTGHASRLNRLNHGVFGDPKYAKEELVAELTAAMIGNTLGFDKHILDNNAAYLDNWIRVLREEPKFIVSVMADVNKASAMVLDEIDKQKIALGERPLLDKNRKEEQAVNTDVSSKVEDHAVKEVTAVAKGLPTRQEELAHFSQASIVKQSNGSYAVRASLDGKPLGMREIPAPTARLYFSLTDKTEQKHLLGNTLLRYYDKEVKQAKAQKTTHSINY